MKFIILSFIVLSLASCSSNSVCDCVEAGNALNDFSNAQFMKETRSQEDVDKMDALLKSRDEVCAEFQSMDAKELQEASMDCESLKIEVE